MKLVKIDPEIGKTFFKQNSFNSPFDLSVYDQTCDFFVTVPSEYVGDVALLDSGIKCESSDTDPDRLYFAKCLRDLSVDLKSPVIYFHEFMAGKGFNDWLNHDIVRSKHHTFYRFKLDEASLESIAEISSVLHADKLFFGFITDESENPDFNEIEKIFIVFLECFDNEYEIVVRLNPIAS